jgi:hypothetical protein
MSTTKKIMVIRHAEKPVSGIKGITAGGTVNKESLIVLGWQRAGALAVLFDPFNGALQNSGLATPNALYAAAFRVPKKDATTEVPASNTKTDDSKSMRPVETIIPLSQRLKLVINENFGRETQADMVTDAMKQTGTVLIAWQHQDIPTIAKQICPTGNIPTKWPGDRFDLVWVFDLDENTGEYAFSQVPQNLLAGDLNTVIEVTPVTS